MTTKYYRIENRNTRAYNMVHGGTILAVDGEKEWLLESRFNGINELRGGCYREFVYGHEQAWPKAAAKAIDKTDDMAKIIQELSDELPLANIADLSARQIRELLGL